MARKEPTPISLKKTRQKLKLPTNPNPEGPIEPFNMDAPEHKEPTTRIVKKVVKDKALEARVTRLEGTSDRKVEVTVELPSRPRIERISIEYDPVFGHPKALIPTYGE